MTDPHTNSSNLIDVISSSQDSAVGVTSSPSTTLDITIDIKDTSSAGRTLGQMVYVLVEEDGEQILVIGQVIGIKTQNRWHEDPAFKGVIKKHGKLPHLSGQADNRVATLSVQACYNLGPAQPQGHILGNSPSTGLDVKKMTNEVMTELISGHKHAVTYLGKVYGTDVDLPLWFKHFGSDDKTNLEDGAGDAYHIGVFGKTGSGKSVTAAFMLLGYAKNKNNMSILVLDPQKQFYLDQELLPENKRLEDFVNEIGMNFEKYDLLEDVCLPGDRFELFGEIILNNGFISEAFRPMYTEDKLEAAKDEIVDYLLGRARNPNFNLNNISDGVGLLREMLTSFGNKEVETRTTGNRTREIETYSKHITNIYGTAPTQERLYSRITSLLENLDNESGVTNKWTRTLRLFSTRKADDTGKLSVEDIVNKTVKTKGNFVVLDISSRDGGIENENLQALFISIIEKKIIETGAELYAHGDKANCLIVMDEAHRFISNESSDPRIKELTREIIDSVRTTRKYGIGYMFITQTIESLDREILRQMRVFSFGYGITSGPEIKKIAELVGNPAAVQLYKSFIDPSSNKKFPFMFFGPVSPLSFTGSPLFLEAYTTIDQLRTGLGMQEVQNESQNQP